MTDGHGRAEFDRWPAVARAACLRGGVVASTKFLDEELGFQQFDLLPEAIIAVDGRGVIRYANREAGRMFGREVRTLVSNPVEVLLPEHLRERHIAHRARYNADPRMRQMGTGLNLVARRADGTTFPVDIMLNPLTHLAEPMVLVIVRDMTERRAAEEQKHLLMRETSHRAKNILSVVQAIAHQTNAKSYQEFIARFDERIQSLSASLNLLVKGEWRDVSLVELVCAQLNQFGDLVGDRIIVRGPDLRIRAAAAQAIGMALHELATNAAKYGALSTEKGYVEIVWRLDEERFTMEWSEKGGPLVVHPTRHGFGWNVLCQMTKMSLGADVTLEYASTGLVWRVGCGADRIRQGEGACGR
jgi:PAS domain S-box-containing protein